MTVGLRTFWFVLHVRLRTAVRGGDEPDDQQPLDGYYRVFGVTAHSQHQAAKLVTSVVEDGEIDWIKSESSEVDPETLDADVIARAGDWMAEGIWYASGRALYSDQDTA
ncbi:MAG TPA: hypothetical protein VHR45_18530 [Thermoanaerobaculia bacterium]|nr:hypothetical protein [Thermoanaerobaculia bacterium]